MGSNWSSDEAQLDIVLVTALPADSTVESFQVRPNNHLLAATLDKPELYDISPFDRDAPPRLLCTFPGKQGCFTVCPVPGRDGSDGGPEEYTIITADHSDMANCDWRGFSTWRLKIASDGTADATPLAPLTDVGQALGVCSLTERFQLVCDSTKSCIQIIDTVSGASQPLLSHAETMTLEESSGEVFGLNRVIVEGEYVYYSNLSTSTMYRVPFEKLNDGKTADQMPPIRVTGPPELIAEDLENVNDFLIAPGGTAALIMNEVDGSLAKMDLSKGVVATQLTSTMVRPNLQNPTAVIIGRPMEDGSGRWPVFVTCCGEIEVGDSSNAGWSDIAQAVSSAHTAVTTEEVKMR